MSERKGFEPTDAQGTDPTEEGLTDTDTEGHRLRNILPTPPAAVPGKPGPGEHRIPVGLTDDDDTEGHLQFRRRPGEAGE